MPKVIDITPSGRKIILDYNRAPWEMTDNPHKPNMKGFSPPSGPGGEVAVHFYDKDNQPADFFDIDFNTYQHTHGDRRNYKARK